MVSSLTLLRLMKALAALACLAGIALLTMGIVGTLSMGSRVFIGQLARDSAMLALILLPMVQLALLAFASKQEGPRPTLAVKLYAFTIVPLVAVLAATASL